MKIVYQAALILAAAVFTTVAQPSVTVGNFTFMPTSGSQANVSGTGTAGARGFATVIVNGRTKTIGATSTSNGTAADIPDIDGIRGPPVMSPVDTDPTEGVPAPPVMSPGPAGEEGAVRLVDRVDVNGFATGTLQVFCEGAWGAVCSSNFDDRDAAVACRQLGFSSGARRVERASFRFRARIPDPEETAPFALENLGCSGNETRLVDCPVFEASDSASNSRYDYYSYYNTRDYNEDVCDPFRGTFARVACGASDAASDGDVRLANGVAAADGSAEYGRLEVFSGGGWGTVCDNAFINRFGRSPSFSEGSAGVACQQLGYQRGYQIQRLEDPDEESTERAPIVLSGSSCDGSEEALTECPGIRLGMADRSCRHEADVHLVCYNGPNPGMDGATRLVDGSADPAGRWEYGRLEIFARGFWSNVCNNDRFTPDAAQVACRALGYGGGAALRFTQSYANSLSPVLFENLPVALASVDCDGTEATISECQSNENFIGDCDDITSSTVLACANSAPGCGITDGTTEGSVRLRGGFGTPCDPVYTGFIEVLHFDEWGSICTDRRAEDRAEDNLVADVVCRQLGFPHGTRVDPLTARAPPEEAPSPYSYYYYSYYDYSNQPVEEAEEPVERYWLNSVECSGPETELTQCNLGQGFRQNNAGCTSRFGTQPNRLHIACRQFPVVEALEELQSPGAEEGDLRLIDQGDIDNWTTGRLQVFFEGSWSQVCSSNFNAPDADVACRQLGFGAGTIVPQALTSEALDEFRRNNIYPEVAITNAECAGDEARLVDCGDDSVVSTGPYYSFYSDVFSRDCLNSQGEGLVLGCVTAPLQGPAAGAEGDLRITNKTAGAAPGAETGILEVFHAGAWGTLCQGSFGILESTAELACREMGFVSGILQNEPASSAVLPPWLSGIRCSGAEAAVAACPRSAFGETASCGPTQRLVCVTNRQGTGEARLVGGRADPGGAWEYGVLEVVANGVFNTLRERFSSEGLGRRGAQVACRSLGYAGGGQLLVGDGSPFITPDTALTSIRSITCAGSEADLGECDVDVRDYDVYDYGDRLQLDSVALVCTNPSGCTDPNTPPVEGDVRLVPLNGTAVATQACDDVHFGGVELFREGRWGRICAGRFGGRPTEFTLDAQVVCRQLGFPFGTVMDNEELFGAYEEVPYFEQEEALVWATEVECTGKEERLDACVFPQNFGVDYEYTYEYYFGGYNENWPAPAHAEPAEAPTATASAPAAAAPPAPPPSNGLPRSRCRREEDNRLAVICRRFEATESDFIRR